LIPNKEIYDCYYYFDSILHSTAFGKEEICGEHEFSKVFPYGIIDSIIVEIKIFEV
jgi:hypothetical protein